MSLAKKIFSVGIWTAASRVMGFARDMLIARYLGAGRQSDIFLMAFKLPNLFRDLLGEGALSSVFVPMFAAEKKSASFASNALSWLLAILLCLTLAVEIFMPLVMMGLASGFDPEKLRATVFISRIMFGYVILICAAGFLSAVLNAFSDFVVAAVVPLLLNAFLIAGLLVFGMDLPALSVAVLAAGIVQLGILWLRLRRRKFGLRLVRPRATPLMRKMTRRMGYGLLGSGFYQLNIFVGVMLASFQSGAVSWLYYADRLVQLPFAVAGLAAGTVLLSKISDAIAAGKMTAVYKYQGAAMRQSMMLTMPCVAGLTVLGGAIVKILFQHGQWSPPATGAVASAILIQSLVLPFMTSSQIYLKTLYASGDAKAPVVAGAASLGLGIALMLCASPFAGYLCVPMGTLGSGIVRNIWLRRACVGRGLCRRDQRTSLSLMIFALLSAMLGAGLFMARNLIAGPLALALAIALGATIYLPTAFFCDKIVAKKLSVT